MGCNPEALKHEIHTCFKWGCNNQKKTLRQSKRIDYRPTMEDFFIRYFQSLIIVNDGVEQGTKFEKYFIRLSYIILKTGKLGVYKDSSDDPIFGRLENEWYNMVGDLVEFSIEPYHWGLVKNERRWLWGWTLIKDSSFAVELPQKKGIRAQNEIYLESWNDSLDGVRINQDNSAIKHYLHVGTIPENFYLQVDTQLATDNSGIAVISEQMLPKNPEALKELKDDPNKKKSTILDELGRQEGKGLIENRYQDVTDAVWLNSQNWLKMLFLNTGIRFDNVLKKANLSPYEAQRIQFSFDIAENYVLKTFQDLVNKWNKLFGENNTIKKAVTKSEEENNEESF